MDEQLEHMAEILKVLGHPVRLQIVLGLLEDDCNVKTIWQRLQLPQATVSQHLAQLKAKGVVKAQRKGVNMCYSVCDDLAACIMGALQKNIK